MVDVVITYVDGDKGNFKNDYNKLIKKEYNELRFRSYGVLDLQVKLIRKYMSFVDNIFVIVSDESQIPDNFNRSLCKFIYHRDIIPQKYLPTFNSCCIEMFMHKIPGLNNKFIYFNDDIFCIDTLSEDDFFINDKPCLYPLTIQYNKDESIYINNLYNSTQEIASLYKTNKFKDKYIKHTHIARPFLKTTCQKVSSFCKDDILNSLTRTRHSRNFNATLFNNYDYITNKYIYKKINSETFSTFFTECINYINDKSVKIVCINDNDVYVDFDEFKEDLKRSLEANLYNIKYVKPIKKQNIIKKENVKKIENKLNVIKEEINIKEVNKEINEEKIIEQPLLKVALCAIAKNENLYIREWVEWYKNLGISKIFLYDNNDIDGERFEEVINDYIESGFVEVLNWRGIVKSVKSDKNGQTTQGLAYHDCYYNHYKEYDWMCFFDIDEYLEIYNTYKNLNDFLYNFYEFDGIRIQWKMYGDNEQLHFENKSLFERFKNEANVAYDRHVKQILKCKKYPFELLFCAHGVLNKNLKCVNVLKNVLKNTYMDLIAYDNLPIYVNHFFSKSTEEFFIRKFNKTSAVTGINNKRNFNIDFLKKQYFEYNKVTNEKEKLIDNLLKNIKNLDYKPDKFINKTFDFSTKINVSFTTYPLRENTIKEMLVSLKNQTIKPNRIICWLSYDEYTGKLSDTLLNYYKEGLVTEYRFTPGNIYGHKRYEIFKYYNNDINILVDDDIIYPETYIEELVNAANIYDMPITYISTEIEYKGITRELVDIKENNISYKNVYFSGLSCFPPQKFPVEMFNFINERNKYCEKCDDSWVRAWLIKTNTVYMALHSRFTHKWKSTENSQDVSIWKTHNGKLNEHNCLQVITNFANAVIATGITKSVKNIWPDFDIENCADNIIPINFSKTLSLKYNIIPYINNGQIINTERVKNALIHRGNVWGKFKDMDLDNPKLIYEKIQYLKIYDNLTLKAFCSDKILVHEYCKQKIGKDICIPIIKVYDNPTQINLNELPNKFVLKCNHGYKMNIICEDKSKFNLIEAINNCNKWLDEDFGLETLQLQYSLINRKCFIEQFMTNGSVGLTDYKFWCQNGEPKFIMVINDRYNEKKHANIYDLNWKPYDLGWESWKPNYSLKDNKPKTLNLMIEYAKKLSEDFKFVRVDFYEINDKCYLGELTFTPDNGFFHFNKDKEIELGNTLSI